MEGFTGLRLGDRVKENGGMIRSTAHFVVVTGGFGRSSNLEARREISM